MKALSAEVRRAIVKDYIDGGKVVVIALHHRVSPWSVSKVAKRAGVARKTGRPRNR